MMDGYDMSAWGWFVMLMVVVIPAAVVGRVAWSGARGLGRPRRRRLSAREQLDARLAQGEIHAAEYRERAEALSAPPLGLVTAPRRTGLPRSGVPR